MVSCANTHLEETVRSLIHLQADPTSKDGRGCTSVHIACQRPEVSLKVLKILLDSGGRIHDQDNGSNTCLHMASRNDKGAYVDWLLVNGTDPSLKNNDDRTAWEGALERPSSNAIAPLAFRETERREESFYDANYVLDLMDYYQVDQHKSSQLSGMEWH